MELPRNSFKLALAAGQQQLGLWSGLSSNYTVEVIVGVGYDWLLLDTENSLNDLESMLTQFQATAPYQTPLVVRVAWNDTLLIKRYLDIGAQSLLVPFVQNADEAQSAVAATLYPPLGVRGVTGGTRARRASVGSGITPTARTTNCACWCRWRRSRRWRTSRPFAPSMALMACSSARPTCMPTWAKLESPAIRRWCR